MTEVGRTILSALSTTAKTDRIVRPTANTNTTTDSSQLFGPIMPESAVALQIREIEILWDDLQITYARSGGPGGQNVNKVNTKVQLGWSPVKLPEGVRQRFHERFASRIQTDGEITIVGQEFRDQKRNLEACVEKLREMIVSVLNPPKRRRPTKPTRGSVERRIKEKKQQTERKQQRRVRDVE